MPHPTDPADSDFVDRVFAYLQAEFPDLPHLTLRQARDAVRQHFAGERAYIPVGRSPQEREALARDVLALFNGRNAREVARRLNIGRATVYRVLKQARVSPYRLSFGRPETKAELRSAIATVPRRSRRATPDTHQDAAWPSPNPTSTPSTPPSPAVSSPSATTGAPSPTEA